MKLHHVCLHVHAPGHLDEGEVYQRVLAALSSLEFEGYDIGLTGITYDREAKTLDVNLKPQDQNHE